MLICPESQISTVIGVLRLAGAPGWLTVERLCQQDSGRRNRQEKESYREYVESAIRQGLAENPWEKLTAQTVLGSAQFARRLRRRLTSGAREQTGARRQSARPGIESIISTVAKVKGEHWEDFRDRYGDWGRDLVLFLGRRRGGHKLRELGQAAGGMDYMAVSLAVHRFGRRMEKDARLRATLSRCEAELNKCKNV